MITSCPSCNSTDIIFEYGWQSYCCSECGLVLDDFRNETDSNDPMNQTTDTPKNFTLPPLLEARYTPVFEQLQRKFKATDEETDFVRQLCLTYLSHPDHIFENSALEIVLCLFYLVVLQHLQDRSLLLPDYCQLLHLDTKRCLAIYAAVRPIVSTKLASLPRDYDPQHQLDNVMRFLYPALLQSATSSPTLQQPQPLFFYHSNPFTAHKKGKRKAKRNQRQQKRKQQRSSATISDTALEPPRSPLTPLPPETTHYTASVRNTDQPQLDTNIGKWGSNEEFQKRQQQQTTVLSATVTISGSADDDDIGINASSGEPLIWPATIDDGKIRQQTMRLMTVIKHNGVAEGRYGRPLMSACLLITMLGWFHDHQRQKQQPTSTTMEDMKKAASTHGTRSASLLPVVVIQWDELNARQLANSTTKSRYREMMGLLYTFGKRIPWLKETLSMERDVLHHLGDILQMMEVLQINNKHIDKGTTSAATPPSSFEPTTAATTPSSSSSDTTIATVPAPTIAPFLPPSFERATRVRQKRQAELDAVDQGKRTQQQQQQNKSIANPTQMVASLIASGQYDREAILAMSDSDLVKHAYRVTSLVNGNRTPSSSLDLDRQLDDFDLSNEELASYLA
ncbi:hypothetical protein BCR42DRAFT_489388 [Absidia repens]|uniref:TFIIB-type domain-containing protein n=1 Tax=Absidia repens TaxID=90262 RepID=A0A1X2IN54_9FUNG|nr:hypothetical protein BCR42DRAFT_489388 [Absidia repens]